MILLPNFKYRNAPAYYREHFGILIILSTKLFQHISLFKGFCGPQVKVPPSTLGFYSITQCSFSAPGSLWEMPDDFDTKFLAPASPSIFLGTFRYPHNFEYWNVPAYYWEPFGNLIILSTGMFQHITGNISVSLSFWVLEWPSILLGTFRYPRTVILSTGMSQHTSGNISVST